jgi:hypothetical protein
MKTYKVLADMITGFRKCKYYKGDIVSADKFQNLDGLIELKMVEEIKTEPKKTKTDEKI